MAPKTPNSGEPNELDHRGSKPDRRAINRMDGYNDRRRVKNDTLKPTTAAETSRARLNSLRSLRLGALEDSINGRKSTWYDD